MHNAEDQPLNRYRGERGREMFPIEKDMLGKGNDISQDQTVASLAQKLQGFQVRI